MILRTCRRASLTIEAALVLPVFMTGLLTLVSALLMLLTGMRIQASLQNTAQHLAILRANGSLIPMSDIREEIVSGLSEEDLKYIENGSEGIDISASDVDDREYINLQLDCDLKPVTDVFGLIRIPFHRRSLTHIWCGYEGGYFPDGQYVYITDDSDVYHTRRDCSHIRLTINEIDPSEVTNLRNDNGSRYRPCEICHAKLSDEKLYITPDGNRYHNSITCSGLKRTVRAVKIGDVRGRRPCKRCGR